VRAVTFLGVEDNDHVPSIEFQGLTLFQGETICLPDEEAHSHPFQAGVWRIEVREATVSDVVPNTVQYDARRAEMDVTCIIPHYKTWDLTRQAVESFRAAYPAVPVIVVDDGSRDESSEQVRRLGELERGVQALILDRNIGQGAALHRAILEARSRRVFTMDSDVVVQRRGFIEMMESRMIEQGLYAIGMMYWRDWAHGNLYVTCVAAMYDRDVYLTLPPFVHEGDPMQRNMDGAKARGLTVEEFPILRWVKHLECGTRRHFGYRWDM